jgi:hypothetical protein
LDTSDISNIGSHPQKNVQVIFRSIDIGIEASDDGKAFALVDILAGLIQLHLECGQREVVLADCIAIKPKVCPG